MRQVTSLPTLHFFVCANARPPDSPLGPGCGAAGEEVFSRLKDETSARRRVADVWVTKTACLGICPRQGATVAIYPRGAIVTEVTAADAPSLFAAESGSPQRRPPPIASPGGES